MIRIVDIDAEDIAVLIMASTAFNMGFGARVDRAPETVAELDNAISRVKAAFDIVFASGDEDA